METVKSILSNNYVRPDEAQKVLSQLRQKGSHTVIDMITVSLNMKDDYYEAEFSNLGLTRIPISEEYPEAYDRLANLYEYADKLPELIAQDLESKIVDYYNVINKGDSGDSEVWDGMDEGTLSKTKEMLDDMHKRKIDLADGIYVINVGGYIGDSTRSEIAYAKAHGKKVEYLEK